MWMLIPLGNKVMRLDEPNVVCSCGCYWVDIERPQANSLHSVLVSCKDCGSGTYGHATASRPEQVWM